MKCVCLRVSVCVSQIIPVEDASEFARRISNCRLVIIPDADHMFHPTAPATKVEDLIAVVRHAVAPDGSKM